jgi:plastocyanin
MMRSAIASTFFAAACACIAGCSTSSPPSGGNTSSSSSGGSGGGGSSSGGTGGMVPVMFDFGTTLPSLNGGKGQVVNAHVGDTVIWKNDDVCSAAEVAAGAGCVTGGGVSHGVVGCTDVSNNVCGTPGDAGPWSTYLGVTGTGDSMNPPIVGQFQFTSAGTYQYDCSIHGNMMIGQVVVTP